MAQYVQTSIVKQAEKIGLTADHLMAAVPGLRMVGGEVTAFNRSDDRACDEWLALVQRAAAGSHGEPATPAQISFLTKLLHGVIAAQDGSAYGKLIREDHVDQDAVRLLSKTEASRVISSITGR